MLLAHLLLPHEVLISVDDVEITEVSLKVLNYVAQNIAKGIFFMLPGYTVICP